MLLAVFILASVAFWFVMAGLQQGYSRYQQAFTSQAHNDLKEMFLFLDPAQVWAGSLYVCALLAVLAYLFTGSVIIAGMVAMVALFAPPCILARARRLRVRKLEHQLPDLLLELAGALRAGVGIQPALRHSAEHAAAPLSQELALMMREQRMGIPLEQALLNFHQRVPVESVSLIVSAMNIAAQSGGSLAETLERISVTLRTRLYLLGRIRALTAQGRMQMWVLAGMPPALALILHWLDPGAMSALWSTPGGWAVLCVVVALEAAGIYFINRIVRIEV